MDDLISRQAAIDELHGKDPSQIWDTADIEVWLNTLPSIQPESCKGVVGMKTKEFERIENAIRHIQTAVDVDSWAMEIAIDAMKRQLPQAPMRSVNNYNHNIIYLYCPRCGTWVGMSNVRLKKYDMYNSTNKKICGKCGQVFNLDGMIEGDKDGEQ